MTSSKLAYEFRGEGETTVVMLHGVFMDRRLWDEVVPDLDSRILLVDMPAHGDSDFEPGASIDNHVDSIANLLSDLEVHSPVIVGHSWGGMVALRLAQTLTLSGLVLVNTPLSRTTGTSRLGFIMQRALLLLGLPLATYGKLAITALVDDGTLAQRPSLVAEGKQRAKAIGREGLRETLRSVLLETEDSVTLLSNLEIPWRFVAGIDDYVIADGLADQIRKYGKLHITAGGHTTPLESPRDLTVILRGFLELVTGDDTSASSAE